MVDPRTKQEESELKDVNKKKMGRPPAEAPTFPRYSLKESTAVAHAIWSKSGGEPFDPILLANALETTRRSSWFDGILRSSERYGLTSGTVWSNKISLTDLGKAIAAPTDESQIGTNLRAALLTPKLFNEFYNKYNRKPILKDAVLRNVLETAYKVPRNHVEACQTVLVQNIQDYGLKLQQGQESLLWLDNLGKQTTVMIPKGEAIATHEDQQVSETISVREIDQKQEITQAPPTQEAVVKVPRVFISHSKNKKILENVKQMLAFGKFDYRVAEEKETLSKPLSDKVFDLMRECNCAIINVSADQEKKQGDAYLMNENVLIEIGAAFLHYDKRVLLVIDQRFQEKLPSILQGLTAIFYEGQELSFTDGMKLMQALGEFRNKL